MTIHENTIRDNLADKLDTLEEGLVLIGIEHKLPNPHGTKGYIDILAKDAFGNRVIIEIKRSNQTSRQAIHEIFKYVSLFCLNEGLAHDKIRCLIVSTEWSELKVPFAEFLRVAKYQCEGIELSVDDDGKILDAKKHRPVKLSQPISMFRAHSVFLFGDESARDNAVTTVVEAFKTAGGIGCVAAVLDYVGTNVAVISRYSIYLVPLSIRSEVHEEIRRSVVEDGDFTGDEDEESRLSIEDYFGARVLDAGEHCWHDFEIGYPEKFSAIRNSGWNIMRMERWGTAPSTAAADDNEVAVMIAGDQGKNHIHFYQLTSPKLDIQWQEVQTRAQLCLKGNSVWTKGFDSFCTWTKSEHETSSVGFAIYNPLNLPIALFKLLARNDPRYLPNFELIAVDSNEVSLHALLGRIEWDGTTKPTSLNSVFSIGDDLNGLEDFFLTAHFGAQWQYDEQIMAAHGLYYALCRVEESPDGFRQSPVEIINESGSMTISEKPSAGKTIADFISDNELYLDELIRWMEGYQIGL